MFPRIFPDTEIYDHGSETWSSVEDPLATHRIGAVFAFPYVHVVGGADLRNVHRGLDTRTHEWRVFPGLPREVEWPKLIHWRGELWLIGGYFFAGAASTVYSEVWRLDLVDLGLPR